MIGLIWRRMTLGALTMAWISAEAARPLEWRLSGLFRFGDLWVALAEGPAFEDYSYGTGNYAEQALRRLADALAKRRQVAPGGEPASTARVDEPYPSVVTP